MDEAKSSSDKSESPPSGGTVTEPFLQNDVTQYGDDLNIEPSTKSNDGKEAAADRNLHRRWAWVVAFSAFTIHFLVDGCIGSFGIFYPALQREFEARPSLTSFAGSMIAGVYMCSSPFAGFLVRRYSCRLVGFVGGCIATAGFVLASLSPDIAVFMLGYGVIAAVGISMNALPAMIMVNEYFHENRGIGQGVLFAGAGCGVLVLAPVSQILLQEYGWSGAFLITSGLIFNFCVLSLLMRPVQRYQAPVQTVPHGQPESQKSGDGDSKFVSQEDDHKFPRDIVFSAVKSNEPNATFSSENYLFRKGKSNVSSVTYLSMPDLATKLPQYKEEPKKYFKLLQRSDMVISNGVLCGSALLSSKTVACEHKRMPVSDSARDIYKEVHKEDVENCESNTNRSRFCDPSILRHPVYMPILVGGVLIQMAQFIPTTYIPDYCVKNGLGDRSGSIVLAVFGALNVAGRLSAGCLANLECVSSLWMFNAAMLACGISCFLFPLCTTLTTLCVYGAFLGFFIGFSPPLQVLILVEYLGLDNFSASMGFLQMCKGPAALAGPPLAGVVYEWTGNLGVSIVFTAVLYVLATGTQSLVPLIDKCRSRTHRSNQYDKAIEVGVS